MFSLSILQLLLVAASVQAFSTRKVTVQNITDCLTAAAVPQNLPGTANFTKSINPFNQRLPFTPVAVAVPTTVAQVQAAVSCGAKLNITISPKSGGHSYASHGLGGEDGHLMVDLKYFNTVSLDNSTGIATIGPGARLGNVAQSLYSQGKAAFSHGTCPGVGLGGHVLGGGYGYISHTHGLALDNLISADIVLANGSVKTASTTQNKDLFWALRGAGASYGIVTSFKFQTFRAPENNTVFSYNFNWNVTQIRNAHAVLQDYANTTMPLVMNMRLLINSYSITLIGVYYGNQTAFTAEMAPLLVKLGKASSTSIQTQGWLSGLSTYAYGSLTTPIDYDYHETFFAKSLMTVKVNDAGLDAFWAYWNTVARKNTRAWFLIIDLHGGPNSAISAVPDSDTSYAHRSALLKYEFYDRVYSGSYPSNGFSFLNGWVAAITDTMANTTYSPFGMFLNYADTSLSSSQAHTAYWLSHYAKLKTVKNTWDAKGVFSNPQAINRGD